MKNLLLALGAVLLMNSAQALRIEKPYTTTVMVAAQTEAERKAGVRQALVQVLERISGQDLSANDRVKSLAANADSAMLEFAYRAQIIDDPAKTWPLEVTFSQSAVDQLIQSAGLPAWPLERPELLVLVLDSTSGAWLPQPYKTDGAPVWSKELRGLPLKTTDAAGLDPQLAAAVKEQAWPQVQQALLAHDVDGFLIGVIDSAQPRASQWQLLLGEQQASFEVSAQSQQAAFEQAVTKAINHLASSYSASNVNSQQVELLKLQIDGVTSYPAFMNVQAYLEGLEVVESIQSSQILGTSVIVDVKVKGRENFRQLMQLSRQLVWQDEMLPPEGSDPGMRPVWRYLWQD